MLLEQVLHIMLDQDCSRSLCYFRPQMYELLHYAILGKMEKMGKKLCKRLQSHRLNPLNNARFPMNYAVLNLTVTIDSFSCLGICMNKGIRIAL